MADLISSRQDPTIDQASSIECKSPPESMNNSRLPVDIFAVIAENLVDQPHTLAILARTCHVVQYVSERVLYRTITYEHQSKRAEKICDALNNRTAKYVKELIITDIRQAVPDVLFDEIPSPSFISSLFEYVVPPFHLMDGLHSLSFLVAENCPSLSPNVVVALHDIEGNIVEYDPYRGLWECFVSTFQGSLKTFRCTLNLPSSDFSFLTRQAPSLELLQMSTAVPINLPCTPNLRTLEITGLSLHSMLKDTDHLYDSFPRVVHPQTILVLDLRRFQGLPPLLLKSVEWMAVRPDLVAIDLSGLAIYQPELYAAMARSFPNLRVLNGVKLFPPSISTDGVSAYFWLSLSALLTNPRVVRDEHMGAVTLCPRTHLFPHFSGPLIEYKCAELSMRTIPRVSSDQTEARRIQTSHIYLCCEEYHGRFRQL